MIPLIAFTALNNLLFGGLMALMDPYALPMMSPNRAGCALTVTGVRRYHHWAGSENRTRPSHPGRIPHHRGVPIRRCAGKPFDGFPRAALRWQAWELCASAECARACTTSACARQLGLCRRISHSADAAGSSH